VYVSAFAVSLYYPHPYVRYVMFYREVTSRYP